MNVRVLSTALNLAISMVNPDPPFHLEGRSVLAVAMHAGCSNWKRHPLICALLYLLVVGQAFQDSGGLFLLMWLYWSMSHKLTVTGT